MRWSSIVAIAAVLSLTMVVQGARIVGQESSRSGRLELLLASQLLGIAPSQAWDELTRNRTILAEHRVDTCMVEKGFDYTPWTPPPTPAMENLSPVEWAELYGFGVSVQPSPPLGQVEVAPEARLARSKPEEVALLGDGVEPGCGEVGYSSVFQVDREALRFFAPVVANIQKDLSNDPSVRNAIGLWRSCVENLLRDRNLSMPKAWSPAEVYADLQDVAVERQAATGDRQAVARWEKDLAVEYFRCGDDLADQERIVVQDRVNQLATDYQLQLSSWAEIIKAQVPNWENLCCT